MEKFLAICCGAYFVIGLLCFCYLVSKDKITDFTKGDIVLAVVFFPYTITIAMAGIVVWLLFVIWDRLKFTSIIKWWRTPISNKEL
ncbi:hypothetical protein WAX74_17465 [Psychrobacillus sp. FJAT-51614]|uniref:TMhelix containing protein n=1 Tax=Psychrobacillus mangrovi TaxID=3117745 RepID=A0ABU8F8U1_9BACI